MRLIDADALKTRKSINSANYNSIETIQEWIDNAPTIDAVPVVRCGECKYYAESKVIKGDMVCKYRLWNTYYTEADRFCYYGERRDDEHTDQRHGDAERL